MIASLKRILQRRGAYKDVFAHPQANKVLADLKRFCYVEKPHFSDSDLFGRKAALIEGRREVFLRIMAFLNATEEDVRKMKEDYPDV